MCIFVAEINAFVLHMNPRHKFKPQISALCLLLLAVLFVACEADTVPFNIPPTLTVSEATNIYRKGATISGTYTKANDKVGVETFGLLYATNSLLGDADTIFATSAEITAGSYTATLSGLNPSTTYYYATFATSGSSIAKSDISHFTTKANSAPQLGELQISNVTASSCVLSTSVLDDGGSALTLRGFLYKKAPTNVSQLTIQDNQVNVSDDSEEFTATLSSLEENTRYAVCAYAVSAEGVGYSNMEYVTTTVMYIPILSAVSAQLTDVAGSLRVTAGVTSSAMAITERGFVYSTETETPNIENNNKVVAVGNDASFTATLTDLPSDVPVYIRAYAKTSDGIGYSDVLAYIESDYVQHPSVSAVSVRTTDTAHSIIATASVNEGTYEVIERGFVYSTDIQTPTVENKNSSVKATGNNSSFTATISNLSSTATTYIRAYVKTSYGYSYGEALSYKESEYVQPPTVSSINAYSTEVSNTLYVTASVKKEGTYAVSECGFVFSTDTQIPTVENNRKVQGINTGNSFTASITDLIQSQTNYIRAYVRTSSGYSYGETFVYNQTEWPVLTTLEATNIWENTAKLNATMDMRSSSISECGFLWSQNNTTLSLSNGKQTATVSATLCVFVDGLSPNTKYYYRPFARHAKGVTYGAVSSFTTSSDTGNLERDTYGDDTVIE